MQYKFNISTAPHLDSFEAVEKNAKTHLNYGWEFIKIEETQNDEFPYRVTLNWKKQVVPDVPPYSDEIQHISAKQ